MIKVDIEKAYDRIRWNFINYILGDFEFPLALIKVIMGVTLVSMKIIWNGNQGEDFHPSRESRKGILYPHICLFCVWIFYPIWSSIKWTTKNGKL